MTLFGRQSQRFWKGGEDFLDEKKGGALVGGEVHNRNQTPWGKRRAQRILQSLQGGQEKKADPLRGKKGGKGEKKR